MKSSHLRILAGAAALSATLATASTAMASTTPKTTSPCAASNITGHTPVTINFWESMPKSIDGGSGNYGAIHSLVTAFNAAYAGKIVVNDINQSGGYGQTWTQYVSALATHSTPQVVMFDQYNNQSALDTKSLMPVSTCAAATGVSLKAAFLPKVLGAYTTGGVVPGMPFSASVPVMYYNKKAFALAKITTPPTTLAALIADQVKLQKTHWSYPSLKPSSGTYKYGVSLKYDPWIVQNWLALSDLPSYNNGNGHTKYVTSSSFNNKTSQNYVTQLQTIARNGNGLNVYNPSSTNINIAYGNLLDVAYNNSGITFDTTAALGSIQSLLGLFRTNVSLGVAPLPTLTGKAVGSQPPGGNGLFISSANSSNAQIAASWTFIQWMTAAKQLAQWDATTGYLPIRTDEIALWNAKLTPTQKPWYMVGYNALLKGKVDPNTEGPLLGPYSAVNNDIATGLEAALTSPYTSAATALASATSAANSDISSYNSSVH